MGFLSNLFRMPSFDGVTNALLMELMFPTLIVGFKPHPVDSW